MKPIQADYWRCKLPLLNFGDHVTELLLSALGYRFVPYPTGEIEDVINRGECLYAVGSLLDFAWFERSARVRIVVWGCGYYGDRRLNSDHLTRARIVAVRGPQTVLELGLNPNTPTGDPALLLPIFYPRQRRPGGKAVYIPHCYNTAPPNVLSANTLVTKDSWWETLDKILSAEIVMTNSLHGAIVAQAYGVPWALWRPQNHHFDKPGKWRDWAAYLGINIDNCLSEREAWTWWNVQGRFGKLGSLSALIDSFPYPILTSD